MSFHAYYLSGNPTSSSTSGRSVSLEELAALGWKIQLLQNPQDLEQTGRKLAQELGFPLTQGSIVPYSFKLAATNSPQMAQHIFTKLAQISPETGFAVKPGAIAVVAEGSIQFDVEDIISKSWIRLETSGSLIHMLPGAKYRVRFEQNPTAVGVVYINGLLTDLEIIEAKDLENHAVRKAYLRSIGQA